MKLTKNIPVAGILSLNFVKINPKTIIKNGGFVRSLKSSAAKAGSKTHNKANEWCASACVRVQQGKRELRHGVELASALGRACCISDYGVVRSIASTDQ